MKQILDTNNTKGLEFLKNKSECPFETDLSREIRILSEVEKIWIIFDADNSGTIDKVEVHDYIKYMAGDGLRLTDQQIEEIYSLIDTDYDGSIDKNEMEVFLKALMSMQKDLKFKGSSQEYLQTKDKRLVENGKKRNPNKKSSPQKSHSKDRNGRQSKQKRISKASSGTRVSSGRT